MESCKSDFSSFDGRVWLNCAHQGPMPRVAAIEAQRIITEKMSPYLIRDEAFHDVPMRLRSAIGAVIRKPSDEIILGNSASYGINVILNGLRWKRDDEVLVVEGDFPANVLPWLRLRECGVRVRAVVPGNEGRVEAEDIVRYATSRTKVVCMSWVNSFTRWRSDLKSIGQVCKGRGIVLVANVSQGLGTLILDLAGVSVDAIVCAGYKWLCGPYGTGFCWCSPELRRDLAPIKVNWWPLRSVVSQVVKEGRLPEAGSDAYDIFCTANFLNYVPWIASIEYLVTKDLKRIAVHNASLVNKFVEDVDWDKYYLISADSSEGRSPLVVFSSRTPVANREVYMALRNNGVDIAIRNKTLRMSPHCYNGIEDIDRAVSVLNSVPSI